jgi:hypothetical protein
MQENLILHSYKKTFILSSSMAAEKLASISYIGPRTEDELCDWIEYQGGFVVLASKQPDEGMIVGVGSTELLEVGHPRAATQEWAKANSTPAWGVDEQSALRKAIERRRLSQHSKSPTVSRPFPKNVVEFKSRKSA